MRCVGGRRSCRGERWSWKGPLGLFRLSTWCHKDAPLVKPELLVWGGSGSAPAVPPVCCSYSSCSWALQIEKKSENAEFWGYFSARSVP